MDGSPLTFRSEPCAAVDPLQVFAAAGAAPRFYWEQPSAGCFRVGVGCAARLTVRGHDRFRAADELARETFGRIGWEGPGPRISHLLGGFAFAPAQSTNGLWQGFADGELRLPELVYWRERDRYVRDARVGSQWTDLRPRPLSLGHPVRGVVEIGNGGPEPYVACVERILDGIRAGDLQKVVLAREVHITAGAPLDAVAWLVALRERYPGCTLFAVGEGDAVFLGASPERLVRVEGDVVVTAALAGTAPRGASRTADHALGAALCDSSKNGAEHAIVVSHLRGALEGCCDEVEVASEPVLLRTRTVQHLCTEIRARRRAAAPVSLLELADRLHPTPAVGGDPRDAAMALIARLEPGDRGRYAGPVGWVDGAGNGRWAVGIRSAELDGTEARLWAGVGIVADSDPQAELEETRAKAQAMLGALVRL